MTFFFTYIEVKYNTKAITKKESCKMSEPDYRKLVEETRNAIKKGDDQRDAGLPTQIPEVERFDDISYGEDPK